MEFEGVPMEAMRHGEYILMQTDGSQVFALTRVPKQALVVVEKRDALLARRAASRELRGPLESESLVKLRVERLWHHHLGLESLGPE